MSLQETSFLDTIGYYLHHRTANLIADTLGVNVRTLEYDMY